MDYTPCRDPGSDSRSSRCRRSLPGAFLTLGMIMANVGYRAGGAGQPCIAACTPHVLR